MGNIDFKWANLFTQDALICGDLCVEGLIKGNVEIDVGNIVDLIVNNITANTITTETLCANILKGNLTGDICGDIITL